MPERPQDHTHVGEALDLYTQRLLRLAYQGLGKAPEFVKRHQKLIGETFVLSATAIAVATAAINNILASRGHELSDNEVLEGITEESLLQAEYDLSHKALNKAKALSKAFGGRISSTIHH
jgi:hypothetical protein